MTERHGDPQGEVPVETFLGDDPALAMVNADMTAYLAAWPCLAETDEEEELCLGSRVCRCDPGASDD